LSADAEWLPVDIRKLGPHFALHPLRQVPLANRARYRINTVSGNIVELIEAAFNADSVADAAVFYPSQAPGSTAAQAGFCFPAVFLSASAAEVITGEVRGVRVQPRGA
jgi:hypothetical protein